MHIYSMVRQNMTKIYRIISEFFGVQLCFFHLYFSRFCYRIDIQVVESGGWWWQME